MSSPDLPSPPPPPSHQLNNQLNTFTHESPAQSNGAILNDRSNISNSYTPPTLSLPILQVVSIGRDQALKPYWNAQVADWSRRWALPFHFPFMQRLTKISHMLYRLWLPTETD